MLAKIYKIIEKTPIDKSLLIKVVPILKELDELEFYHPAHCYGILDHSIKSAETLDDVFLRLVLIFHDVGKLNTAINVTDYNNTNGFVTKFPNHQQESVRIVKEIFGNEFDKQTLTIFLKLIEYHDTPLVLNKNDSTMKKLYRLYGSQFIDNLLKVQRADMSTHDKLYYENKIKPTLDNICEIYEQNYKKIKPTKLRSSKK